MIRSIILICIIGLFSVLPSQAQMVGMEVGADSISNALVPAAGYSSNEGFLGGIVYNRYDYRGDRQPFNNYLESSAIITTKGFIEIDAKYEQTGTFGRQIRAIAEGNVHRYTKDLFFGIGNETAFSNEQWNDEYYFFESVSAGFNYKIRMPIYDQNDRKIDIQLGLATAYHIPYIRQQQSSFAQQMPNGSDGGWVNNLNTGLVWENRDSEFDPRKGNRAELELRAAPNFLSSYGLTTARLELRQYFPLFSWLTVANRFEVRHAEGDIPYWERSTLGNASTLRGYPLNRFQGNSSLAYTLELRSWILKFPEIYNLKLGGQLFTDTGRVFTPQDDMHALLEGYKQTIGFGGALSIFNPDFILRGEIGFSEEVNRIYIGVGYLF